ncbi:MAG: hypothetical protein MJB57_15050 [Gemmatimonadetes bacterium]|nr:hypothetical protein [Gemmatimonadota bacterium]
MAVVLAISVPKEAHPQVGAFGAAAALGAQGESAHAGSPVFTEHGRVLDRGRTSFSAVGGLTTGSIALQGGGTEGWDFFQLLLSGFLAPVDDLTVGAILSTVNNISFETAEGSSGIGDLSLYGKYRLGGRAGTDLAAVAQLVLPTGETGFGREGLAIAGGLAVSRQLDDASLHASGTLAIPTDDADGDPFVTLSAAGVFGLNDRIGLSAEGALQIGDDTFFSAGPAVRLRASDNVFVDGGVLFPLVTPDSPADSDVAFFVGVNVGG